MEKNSQPWDMGYVCWGPWAPDDLNLHAFFDGRTLDANYSHFNSPVINKRLDAISRLTGRAFNRAYGELDVELARDYAPAVAMSVGYERTLVSARTGCVVTNPGLDLAAVCLK